MSTNLEVLILDSLCLSSCIVLLNCCVPPIALPSPLSSPLPLPPPDGSGFGAIPSPLLPPKRRGGKVVAPPLSPPATVVTAAFPAAAALSTAPIQDQPSLLPADTGDNVLGSSNKDKYWWSMLLRLPAERSVQ